jgi:hypothetical protein
VAAVPSEPNWIPPPTIPVKKINYISYDFQQLVMPLDNMFFSRLEKCFLWNFALDNLVEVRN